ncbi:hypothetical protein Q9233_016579, partial [Columba guinea]
GLLGWGVAGVPVAVGGAAAVSCAIPK